MGKLAEMFKDEAVTLEGSGFDVADFYDMFGDALMAERQADLQEFSERVAGMSNTYDDVTKKNKAKLDGEFFCVLVFPNREAMVRMFDHVGVRDGRYQNGELFARKLGVPTVEGEMGLD